MVVVLAAAVGLAAVLVVAAALEAAVLTVVAEEMGQGRVFG